LATLRVGTPTYPGIRAEPPELHSDRHYVDHKNREPFWCRCCTSRSPSRRSTLKRIRRRSSGLGTLVESKRRRMPMTFEVGARVATESQSTERRARSGTVREVLREDPAPRYRIEWDDGHSTVYTPAAGALHAAPPHAELRPDA
jgi:hypothetical protein